MGKYRKLYAKCEDWARKKRLDVDAKNSDAKDIGGASGKDEENDIKAGQTIGAPPGMWMMTETGGPVRSGTSGATTAAMKFARMSKEKAKARGKGVCYKRGKPGHVAKYCRAKGWQERW